MAVPFGFSVGDFLAVMELTWKVTQALRESAGAVHEVKTILETLMSFQRAISTCQTLALEWMQLNSGEISLPERSLVNGINYQLKFCRERLDKLSAKLEPYTRALMKQKGNRTARDQLYKVKWIFTREEADRLQKDLSIHVQGLERYITELGIQIMLRTMKQSQTSLTTTVASIERTVTEIHRNLTSLQAELPKFLGFTWEGGFSGHDKPIIFMDALGRNVQIPFLFCNSPNDFHDIVEVMFRHLPGHERVKRKSYKLIKQDSNDFIEDSQWSTAISPGSVVVMSIQVTVAVTGWECEETPTISCPRCRGKLHGATTRCSRCYRDCTILEKERIVELAPQPVPPPPKSRSKTFSEPRESGRTQLATPATRTIKRDELAQFQRVHIVRERLRPAWDYQRGRQPSLFRPFPQPTALHLAIASRSMREIERLLENEPALEARDLSHSGWTPLQQAAFQGDYNIVDCLIEEGADINAGASFLHEGRTALQAAAGSGHLEIVERLLAAGAEVNAPTAYSHGRTALQAAAGSGHLDIVERLLAAGAEVNATAAELHGRTALQAAAGSGHLDIVERLLAAGAEVNAPATSFDGQTALQAAAESVHLEIVERLLAAGAEVNAPSGRNNGRTALQAAAESGHLEIVERLLAAGAEVNVPAAMFDGRTALQAAAGSGPLEIVERLLAAGAEGNAPAAESDGRTALQAAAGSGHVEIVERLIEAGADVNAKAADFDGRTALQAAAGSGHLEIVERLLAGGAEVNAPSSPNVGRTALQAAAQFGHLDIVERLLGAGAEVNASAAKFDGRTALQAAAQFGHLEIVDRLLGAGADVNAPFGLYDDRTALQAAAESGRLEIVERLLGAGAEVTARGLETAAFHGHRKIVARLRAALN